MACVRAGGSTLGGPQRPHGAAVLGLSDEGAHQGLESGPSALLPLGLRPVPDLKQGLSQDRGGSLDSTPLFLVAAVTLGVGECAQPPWHPSSSAL